jgi:serine/threonine protein kinase
MMEPLPARIGPYSVQRLIGAGAMGLVYLGHDPAINRQVAIKTIRKHLLGSEPANDDTADRFRLEASDFKVSGPCPERANETARREVSWGHGRV